MTRICGGRPVAVSHGTEQPDALMLVLASVCRARGEGVAGPLLTPGASPTHQTPTASLMPRRRPRRLAQDKPDYDDGDRSDEHGQ
jgi:hypothetical protein